MGATIGQDAYLDRARFQALSLLLLARVPQICSQLGTPKGMSPARWKYSSPVQEPDLISIGDGAMILDGAGLDTHVVEAW